MRDTGYIILALLITWLEIFIVVPVVGADTALWELVMSAFIGGIFAGLLVLLGESVIEDIIKVVILLILGGAIGAITSRLGFILISALLSGVTGVVINQINQYAANKRMQTDASKPRR
jgi:hypothetical protein